MLLSIRWKDERNDDYRPSSYQDRSYANKGFGGSYAGRSSQREPRSNFYGAESRKNELGFHGDTRPNPRVEEELFFKNESQSAGINFDKVLNESEFMCLFFLNFQC